MPRGSGMIGVRVVGWLGPGVGELVHRGGGVIVAQMWWVVGAWCGGSGVVGKRCGV